MSLRLTAIVLLMPRRGLPRQKRLPPVNDYKFSMPVMLVIKTRSRRRKTV